MSENQEKPKDEPKEETKPDFSLKAMEKAEKPQEKTRQSILLIAFGRAGEHTKVIQYYNRVGQKLATDDKAKRIYGFGFCGSQPLTVPLHKTFNRKQPILKRVPKQRRNRFTGKLETVYSYEKTGKFTIGWENVAKHLSKFLSISAEEVKKLAEPYQDAPRIIFYTAYEGLYGLSVHDQPKNLEDFVGFKNYWICSSGMPPITKDDKSEVYEKINKRIKEMAERESLEGYWQVRLTPRKREIVH